MSLFKFMILFVATTTTTKHKNLDISWLVTSLTSPFIVIPYHLTFRSTLIFPNVFQFVVLIFICRVLWWSPFPIPFVCACSIKSRVHLGTNAAPLLGCFWEQFIVCFNIIWHLLDVFVFYCYISDHKLGINSSQQPGVFAVAVVAWRPWKFYPTKYKWHEVTRHDIFIIKNNLVSLCVSFFLYIFISMSSA